MKKKTLQEILEYCKQTNSVEELLQALSSTTYAEDSTGKKVKIKIYKDAEGKAQTEILSVCDYRDIGEMSLAELQEYLAELEEQYEELECEEPDDSESEEYEEWEENLEEIEEEISDVKEKIEELDEQDNH